MNKKTRGLSLFVLCLVLAQSVASGQIYGWRKRLPAVGATVGINPLNPNSVYAEGSPGVIYASFNRGKSWSMHMTPGMTQIRQILVHPNDTTVIFCANSDGSVGLVKSSDYGQTWRTVLPGYHIDGESVTYDPQHPDTMYAGQFAVGKVYRSLDRGETWTYQGTANDLLCAFNVRPDSSNILFAGTGGGSISKSTNYGFTWRVVKPALSSSEVPKISVSLTDPMVAYATVNGGTDSALGVWKTSNGGESWFKTYAPHTSMWGMDVDPHDGNIVYVGTFDFNVATVYKTTDGGGSWIALPAGLPVRGDVWSLKVHPLAPDLLWAAVTSGAFGFEGIYRYTYTTTGMTGYVLDALSRDTVRNGYVSISETGDSVDLGASRGAFTLRYFDADPSLTPTLHARAYPYFRSDDQIAFTQDSIRTQNVFLKRLTRASISGVVRDSASQLPRQARIKLFQSSLEGSVVYHDVTDSGGTFRFDSLYVSQPPVLQYDRVVIEPEIPLAYTSLKSITLDTNGLSLDVGLVNADVLLVSATDNEKYSPYYQVALESIATSYSIWNSSAQGPAPLSRGPELKKKAIIYYTGDSHTPIGQGERDSIVACLNQGCNLFLTGQDIAEMNDSSDLMKKYLMIGFGGNSAFSFVTGLTGGLFYHVEFPTNTVDDANNQSSRDIIAPLDVRVKPQMGYGSGIRGTAAIRIDSVGAGGKAIVMGFGYEAISTVPSRQEVMLKVLGYFDGSIVLDAGADRGSLPPSTRIDQNYPNPFNPATTIVYSVASYSSISLTVYNLLGQSVATLVNESKQPGEYTVRWEASGLPTGVYYGRLSMRGIPSGSVEQQTIKLMIMK